MEKLMPIKPAVSLLTGSAAVEEGDGAPSDSGTVPRGSMTDPSGTATIA